MSRKPLVIIFQGKGGGFVFFIRKDFFNSTLFRYQNSALKQCLRKNILHTSIIQQGSFITIKRLYKVL